MRIVYACPALPEAVEATGRFRLMRTRRVALLSHVTKRVSIYESVDYLQVSGVREGVEVAGLSLLSPTSGLRCRSGGGARG